MLLYWLSFDTVKDIGVVALPAVFVGILLELTFRKLQKRSFDNLTDRAAINFDNSGKTLREELRNIISFQLVKNHPIQAKKIMEYKGCDHIRFIGVNYYSRSYSSENLSMFRSPKSYGILCYNSFLVCFIMAIFSFVTAVFPFVYGFILIQDECRFLVPVLLCGFGWVFLYGSRLYYLTSLKMELSFWSQLTEMDLNILADLMNLYDHLNPPLCSSTD